MNTGLKCLKNGCGIEYLTEKEARQCELRHLIRMYDWDMAALVSDDPAAQRRAFEDMHYLGPAIDDYMETHWSVLDG